MKKSERIEILEDKVDDLGRTIAGLKALFDETRQTVFALTDKLDAEEANEALAADMANLDSEAQDAAAAFGDRLAQRASGHITKIFMDDLIDQKAYKTKDSLTAEDVITAAKELAELPDDYDFPTDEDLERIDQLMDQLARDHE